MEIVNFLKSERGSSAAVPPPDAALVAAISLEVRGLLALPLSLGGFLPGAPSLSLLSRRAWGRERQQEA